MLEPGGMIGMGVRDEDHVRHDGFDAAGPVLAAIEERAPHGRFDQKRAVTAMKPAGRIDGAPCAEKGEFHGRLSSSPAWRLEPLIGRKARGKQLGPNALQLS